jgi:hypothetical protein
MWWISASSLVQGDMRTAGGGEKAPILASGYY